MAIHVDPLRRRPEGEKTLVYLDQSTRREALEGDR